MASQKLQDAVRVLGGEWYDEVRFGFEVKTEEEGNQVNKFFEHYKNVLDLDPESTTTTRIFHLKETELTQLPKELVGTIFTYLPESQIENRFNGHKELEFAQQYAIENGEALTTDRKDTLEYYRWLKSHRHLKRLVFSPSEEPQSPVELIQAIGTLIELEELDLRFFNFSTNENVKVLADALKSLPLLKSLNLLGCSLTDEGLTYLVPYLNNLQNLQAIDFGGNKDLTIESLKLLIPTFERCVSLGFGDINSRNYTLTRLFPFLTHITGLIRLDLRFNQFEPRDIGSLAKFLSQFSNLESLNLLQCSFTENDMKTLAPVLLSLSHIKEFTCDTDNPIVLRCLLEIIGHWSELKSLTCFFPNVDDITIYVQTLLQLPQLQTLRIPTTRFSREHFDILAPVLQRLPLTILDLTLRNPNPAMLDTLFSNLSSLQSLTLNILGTKDVRALGHLISLESLYLQCGDTFILSQDLSAALIRIPNLQKLTLHNDFDEHSEKVGHSEFIAFLQDLGLMRTLTELLLGITIDGRELDQIRLIAPQLTELESVHFRLDLSETDDLSDLIQKLGGIIGAFPSLKEMDIYLSRSQLNAKPMTFLSESIVGLKSALSKLYPGVIISVC